MTSWTFSIKFPYDTQFTFGSLMFSAGKDGNFKMLPPPPGSAPERLTPIYGQAPYLLVISSTSCGVCLGLDPYAGPYICTTKLIRDIPIVTSTLQPSARASTSSSSAASPDQDSANDYLEIGGSTCWDSTEEGHLIIMVAPAGGPSNNSSNRYPTIGRSKASDTRTLNDEMI
jgi:hypothetical protein